MKRLLRGLLCASVSVGISWLGGVDFTERGLALALSALTAVVAFIWGASIDEVKTETPDVYGDGGVA